MKRRRRRFFLALALSWTLVGILMLGVRSARAQVGPPVFRDRRTALLGHQTSSLSSSDVISFSFVAFADVRNFSGPGTYDTSQYFRGATEAISDLGDIAFILSPGDLDPLTDVWWTITRTLGVSTTWYPAVGNHELPGQGHESYRGANIAWLKAHDYGPVNPGPTGCPTTTYSFDYGNGHFVVLNEYCDHRGADVTDGDVSDHLYQWLVDDLNGTDAEHVFVVGHEPAYPQPDADNGRLRHVGDSLDGHPWHRDRFWQLLRERDVRAYVCGHTHNYSIVKVYDMWQVDVGHARGLGDPGARSTFVVVHIQGDTIRFETYRDDAQGGAYTRTDSGFLRQVTRVYLPLIMARRWRCVKRCGGNF